MNGRVALVTGGGRGIGREAALLLSAAGARVMVVSRSATELAAVGLEYVVADLGTAEGCALAPAEADRRGISVEQVRRERAALYPQNGVLEPGEVAQVIAFLCSDAAGGVNGEAITVALGGMW